MKQIKMSWPKDLNINILASVFPDDDLLIDFFADHMNKSLKKRTIVIPSMRTCKKVLAHRLWCRILAGKTTWAKEKKALRKRWGSLSKVGIRKDKIIELFEQRQKEILREITKEK